MSLRKGIIVHGKPSATRFENPEMLDPSDSNWIPWVKRQMTLRGIFTVAPDMPNPTQPNYRSWAREFSRYDIDERTTVVGHSAAAAMQLRWLGDNPGVNLDKLILVAPWIDPKHRYGDFGKFSIAPRIVERCHMGVSVFYSSKDDEEALLSVERIARELPEAELRDIPRYGHFLIGNSMEGPEFPEILEEIF